MTGWVARLRKIPSGDGGRGLGWIQISLFSAAGLLVLGGIGLGVWGGGTGASPGNGNWTTYMGNSSRSGVGPQLPLASTPARAWTQTVKGDVYGEPLVVGKAVYVATEENMVYELTAGSGKIIWQVRLGSPVPLTELVCGNIETNGVTSTPVIDTTKGVMYAVSMLDNPLRHEMFAIAISNGQVLWHRVVDPPGSNPRFQQQRGSLNLSLGRVYFTMGGFAGDCGTYGGWVVGVPESNSGSNLSWRVPDAKGGAIWSPPGPVVDSDGSLLVSTGNGETTGIFVGDNAVIRLSPNLVKTDWWGDPNWVSLNQSDSDIGSGDPALISGGLVFEAGKQGIGYLIASQHLGGVGGEIYKGQVCPDGGGVYGGVLVAGKMLYVPCNNGMVAVRVNEGGTTFQVVWSDETNGNSAISAYGEVWWVEIGAGGRGVLVGVDPGTGEVKNRVDLAGVPHFPSPVAVSGNIYVAGLGMVYAISVK